MSIRKTESRLPTNFQAADLGQAVVSDDGTLALVSFISSPLVVNRENIYVLFVTNPIFLSSKLKGTSICYHWTFTENGKIIYTQKTVDGEISYCAQQCGVLKVQVKLLDAQNDELTNIQILQQIVQENSEIENVIEKTSTGIGPGPGNPAILRELVNDLSTYYKSVNCQESDNGNDFQEFLFNMVYDGLLQKTPLQRQRQSQKVAEALNNGRNDELLNLISVGIGPCQIRLPLLAMTLSQVTDDHEPYLPWMELPNIPSRHSMADLQLRKAFMKLEESTRIDLFNLSRFPKSNITQCAHILLSLRDRYFGRKDFKDVLFGMSGTRAHWIVQHYRKGPVQRVNKTYQPLMLHSNV